MRHSSRTLYIENNFTKREAYTRTPPFLAKKETCLIKASLLSCVDEKDALPADHVPPNRSPAGGISGKTGLLAGGAFAPYERFAAGKTSMAGRIDFVPPDGGKRDPRDGAAAPGPCRIRVRLPCSTDCFNRYPVLCCLRPLLGRRGISEWNLQL